MTTSDHDDTHPGNRERAGSALVGGESGSSALRRGSHLVDGKFQSDKYPTCPAGKVPLSTRDPSAQGLLWTYAARREPVDAEFSADLRVALLSDGFCPPPGDPDEERALVDQALAHSRTLSSGDPGCTCRRGGDFHSDSDRPGMVLHRAQIVAQAWISGALDRILAGYDQAIRQRDDRDRALRDVAQALGGDGAPLEGLISAARRITARAEARLGSPVSGPAGGSVVDLGELRRLRLAMTSEAPWDLTAPQVVSNHEYDVARFESPSDATGVAATHNAADALVDLALAALDLEEARDEVIRSSHMSPGGLDAPYGHYRAALARVRR